MPVVSAIAKAPQNITLAVARQMFAPPAFAPTAPNRARKANEATDTIGTIALNGKSATIINGMAAPTEKVAAGASAACAGRAVAISDIPSSSRA